jgi:hypothetical protein
LIQPATRFDNRICFTVTNGFQGIERVVPTADAIAGRAAEHFMQAGIAGWNPLSDAAGPLARATTGVCYEVWLTAANRIKGAERIGTAASAIASVARLHLMQAAITGRNPLADAAGPLPGAATGARSVRNLWRQYGQAQQQRQGKQIYNGAHFHGASLCEKRNLTQAPGISSY